MWLPYRVSDLHSSSPILPRSGSGHSNSGLVIGLVFAIIGVIVILAVIVTFILHKRLSKNRPNRQNRTPFWKNLGQKIIPRFNYSRAPNGGSDSTGGNGSSAAPAANARTAAQMEEGVNRHTSIRSIMTLPSYAPAPRPTERVLGREGERAGIDVVVEFPETADEEEERRDEEMESLYQIRLARRNEAAAREEQRRQRREGQRRGESPVTNTVNPRALRGTPGNPRNAPPSASAVSLSASLAQEHTAKKRDRRISTVNYAALGLARHDGTRLRADSAESQMPLLGSAVSLTGRGRSDTGTRSRSDSGFTTRHHRDQSATSMASLSTTNSNERPPQTQESGAGDFEVINLQNESSNSSSNPLTPSATQDTVSSSSSTRSGEVPVDGRMSAPPEYENLGWEEAPPYEGPASASRHVSASAPQLPALTVLPDIRITATSPTPTSSVPPTPLIGSQSSEAENDVANRETAPERGAEAEREEGSQAAESEERGVAREGENSASHEPETEPPTVSSNEEHPTQQAQA
ncbi:MAG: hypothetical protein M1819_005207 [Sarea resinae]|nr:MAG: hypothetical protein M1819_005207 [Sarea resinae]